MAHEGSTWSLPVAEIERVVDRVIDGLAKMDAELLIQLACHCREWEGKGAELAIPNSLHARISWKLLLLERLLRQTRINLNVLGLEGRRYASAERHRVFAGR